ncbi:MAG: 4-(cytidine 5'-diphospho)-2-C-methyl-D-erythritol kinase [Clostridia bacterium]|nr:4-(cytidine 5'-diphospho)-2-C-methyl-D-erythritol kinase [Clostridia bacterium]
MKLNAYAKINWTLDICGKREDGYHLLDSIMQSVSLCDTVCLGKAEKTQVQCSVEDLSGEENICFQAAQAFFSKTGQNGGVKIIVEKHIPLAGGLGGGSADAAAVLVGLNRLFETNLSLVQLQEIGLTVGADVPFCITGGTARVRGIGEKIEPLPSPPAVDVLLIKNGIKPSTGEMYRRLDAEKLPLAVTETAVEALGDPQPMHFFRHLGNAFVSVSNLYGVDVLLQDDSPVALGLSGSGPTVFAAFPQNKSESVFRRLQKDGVEVYRCHPVAQGVKIVE